jgi:hypothetical protein
MQADRMQRGWRDGAVSPVGRKWDSSGRASCDGAMERWKDCRHARHVQSANTAQMGFSSSGSSSSSGFVLHRQQDAGTKVLTTAGNKG